MNEDRRLTLSNFVFVLTFICVKISIVQFSVAGYYAIIISELLSVLSKADTLIVPALYVSFSVAVVINAIFTFAACLKIRSEEESSRIWVVRLFCLVTWLGFAISFASFGISIFALTRLMMMEEDLARSIARGISLYKINNPVKTQVDLLQLDFECCGENGYRDWFNVSWLDPVHLRREELSPSYSSQKSGQYMSDDAPFSCCSTKSMRPCIHMGVTSNNRHKNYDHRKDLTLWTEGCRSKLYSFLYLQTTISVSGGFMLAVFQGIASSLGSLIQSSLRGALASGDATGSAPGSCLPCLPGSCGGGQSTSSRSSRRSSRSGSNENLLYDAEFEEDYL